MAERLIPNIDVDMDINELVDELKNVPAEDIAVMSNKLWLEGWDDRSLTDSLFFQPVSHDGIFYVDNAREGRVLEILRQNRPDTKKH